ISRASSRNGRPIMPEAWDSMRSTARWVLPVLVGPSTATRGDGAAPVERSLMDTEVGDSAGLGKRERKAKNESRRQGRPGPLRIHESAGHGSVGRAGRLLRCGRSQAGTPNRFAYHRAFEFWTGVNAALR